MASSSAIPISFDSKRDEPSDVHPKANPRDTVSALLFDGISLTQLARTVPSSLVSKRASNDDDLWRLVSWSVKVAATVAKHGLKESECAELRYGNPQDEPIEGIVDLFANAARPPRGREIDWFAYSFPDLADLKAVAGRLSKLRGFNYHAEDIIVTDGSLAALDLLVFACTDPGDEVIILSPVYFNYPIIIRHREAVPIIVPVRPDNFEPDVDALRRAITPRTKAIIVNSPNNPTGVLYSRESLVELSDMLIEVNATRASPILVISDEAYCRILYDGVTFTSITTVYPYSALTYTTGKTLLAPGQRLGYIAISSLMPDNHRKVLRKALQSAQLVSWAYPSSTLMHSINKLDTMSIDLVRFQGRRDFVCEALSALGYRVLKPSGTFYVCVYIPRERTLGSTVEIEAADEDFCLKLAGRGVLVTPGRCFEWPGVFRISLTANDDQLKRAVEVLATMIRQTP